MTNLQNKIHLKKAKAEAKASSASALALLIQIFKFNNSFELY